jgi:hypothetical protein
MLCTSYGDDRIIRRLPAPAPEKEGDVATNRKGRAAPSPARTTRPVDAGSTPDGDTAHLSAEETARRSTSEDEIRLRAYYRYLEREGTADEEQGDEMTDWLLAEADVLGRRATGVDADSKVRGDAVP